MNHAPRLGLPFDGRMAEAWAKTAQAIGRAEFHGAMLDLLGAACAIDSGGAMVFFRDRAPLRMVHRINAVGRKVPQDRYLEGPYALDPLYRRFLRGAGSGVYWLREIAPDDFFDSEYYRLFYSQLGLSDSIDVMWRIGDDSALLFFLERRVGNPAFHAADVVALNLVLPYVVAATARHHELADAMPMAASDSLTHRKVQSTIENFGRSLLTQREREVLFYMLSGYSSALTAERLATSEGTIKIHRKNIHRKLDIGSQAELFSLFIQCIPFASPEAATDPLDAYQKKPGAPARPPRGK